MIFLPFRDRPKVKSSHYFSPTVRKVVVQNLTICCANSEKKTAKNDVVFCSPILTSWPPIMKKCIHEKCCVLESLCHHHFNLGQISKSENFQAILLVGKSSWRQSAVRNLSFPSQSHEARNLLTGRIHLNSLKDIAYIRVNGHLIFTTKSTNYEKNFDTSPAASYRKCTHGTKLCAWPDLSRFCCRNLPLSLWFPDHDWWNPRRGVC